MINMDTKIETWKNKLLDLGKRNRLLNYKDTKRSNLRIIVPEIYDLWESFVVQEIPVEFPFDEDFPDDYQEEYSVNSDQQASLFDRKLNGNISVPDGVITSQAVKEQQKTLRNLRNKAKIANEEQGINILYLSFGFVRWTEASDSNQYFDAPLILVPVTINWESITSPFVLNLHEDEIVVNPTLLYKLDNDFGIKLPEFDTDDNLERYFEEVRGIIEKSNWQLVTEVGLGLLSFLKINMYRDLENHKDKVLQNPVVRALCGDASALEIDLSEIDDFNHDEKSAPLSLFQVVDADSSQQDAIECAKKGISFILQGPPGTGKSQTITNIIAECLAAGKKVLFVSEKMAALDVVHRRLTNANLNDFCLILHSHKANKKDTLAQLGNVLGMANKKATISDEVFQKLEQLRSERDKLNEYARIIHTPISPLNKTIYEINGSLANLQDYNDIIFGISGLDNVTQHDFNQYIIALNRLVDVIGKMSSDYKSNPWYGANVEVVTNELRHDIGSYLGRLLPKTKSLALFCDEISSKFNFEINTSIEGLKHLVPFFELSSRSPQVPVAWVKGANMDQLFNEVSDCSQMQTDYQSIVNTLTITLSNISEFDRSFDIGLCSELLRDNQFRKISEYVKAHLTNVDLYKAWQTYYSEHITEVLNNAKGYVSEHNMLINNILIDYDKDILGIDYNGILRRFKAEYTSIFKIFNQQYKLDKRLIMGLRKGFTRKYSDEDAVRVLDALHHLGEIKSWLASNSGYISALFPKAYTGENTDFIMIERMLTAYWKILELLKLLDRLIVIFDNTKAKEAELQSNYEFLYKGMSTDWKAIRSALDWARLFRDSARAMNVSDKFIELTCSDANVIKEIASIVEKITDALADIDKEYSWFAMLFESDSLLRYASIYSLSARVESCLNNLASLEEWIDFRTTRKVCRSINLGDYMEKIEMMNIPVEHIIPIFKKRFYRLWLDMVLARYPIVANFRRRTQERTIEDFASLDKLQFAISKARIRSKLINDLPSMERFTSGTDEISVLKRELGKQRRIMPTRRLFKEIPNLILKLKPCLMMSPLSVSLFLEADSFMFDTVIFDEASQVCTENAVGAISRGMQVIIAGDSKQLPPTNFFSATTSDSEYDFDIEDDDEYNDSNAYESILDEAALLPERTLLWHYRSRHEHLITFSNAKIYKNNLITFPSNVDKGPDIGVEYIYVSKGFYDRGGKKGNVIEAAKVAELVFEQIKKYPNRTLGIIAFGEVQQQAIDTAIRKKRMENQAFEDFFSEDQNEPFFIKNLENVQGDERDTIIFSIGYAKDATGKMYMNFGPLSKAGGERRLNVAITRAKLNVKLVGSILPTDIDTEKVSSDGPKLLRGYIDFAINGPSVLLSEITECDTAEHDSPFEAAVYKFLDRKGYKLATQVGCSGYRIDMAVKHPSVSGLYVLGIECDGAAYHSARTARERDRLRQAILEDMGWKIYRIWSTDWIKDPITEGERLIQAVETAISEYGQNEVTEQDDEKNVNDDDFIAVEKKKLTKEQTTNPYGFIAPTTTNFNTLPRDGQGHVRMTDCIELLVGNEYPIHYELMCQKLSGLLGREKATSVVRREVDYTLRALNGRIIRKGDFLYPASYTSVPARILNNRQIKHISIDELSSAMLIIAEKCIGATRASLITESIRAYGFARSGSAINTSLNEAYDKLLTEMKIKEVDGKVTV